MELDKKVVAAITTAVGYYLQLQAAAAQQKTVAQTPPQPYSPWAMAGRASMMDMRRAWQLRLVR